MLLGLFGCVVIALVGIIFDQSSTNKAAKSRYPEVHSSKTTSRIQADGKGTQALACCAPFASI